MYEVAPMAPSRRFAYVLSGMSAGLIAACMFGGGLIDSVPMGIGAALGALLFVVSVPLTIRAVLRRRQRSRGAGDPESYPLETAALWWLALVWIASLGWVIVCLVILATFHLDRLF